MAVPFVIVKTPQANQQVLVDYIPASGTLDPQADDNWSFVPINADVQVVFDTSPSAPDASNGQRFEYLETPDSGVARHRIPMA